MLDNLVGNALKFSRSGGVLAIRAYLSPDTCQVRELNGVTDDGPTCQLSSPLPRLRVEVADTGCGINDADQVRIFDRFFRVENAVHTDVGTGLGLSIVRGILEKHGAQVQMVSEPEIGTTLWFELPLAEADKDELQLQAERRSRNAIAETIEL